MICNNKKTIQYTDYFNKPLFNKLLMQDKYPTRHTLIDRARKQNDSSAWKEFIEVYEKFIYIIIRSRGVKQDDAEDILQQVVIELWKKLPEFEYDPQKAKFRSWIATITRNQTISFIRKQVANAKKMDKVKEDETLRYLESITAPEVEDIINREWEIFIANTAMENMSKHFSSKALKAFKLSLQGKNVDSIAQCLSLETNSIYKYIRRVKLKLAEEVEQLQSELKM